MNVNLQETVGQLATSLPGATRIFERLAQLEMAVDIDDSALSEVATAGFDPIFGARPLKRAIQAQIENPLAKAILEG